MNERKKLKKELGRKYIFKKFMTAGQVRKLFALKNQRLEKIFATGLRYSCQGYSDKRTVDLL